MHPSTLRSEAAVTASPRSSRRLARTIERLSERFAAHFPPRPRGLRRIGRGAGVPRVWPDGRAGDVTLLWEPLLSEPGARPSYDDPAGRELIVRVDFPDAAYEVEMGRATVEVVLPPKDDLFRREAASRAARRVRDRGTRFLGVVVLGYGIQ